MLLSFGGYAQMLYLDLIAHRVALGHECLPPGIAWQLVRRNPGGVKLKKQRRFFAGVAVSQCQRERQAEDDENEWVFFQIAGTGRCCFLAFFSTLPSAPHFGHLFGLQRASVSAPHFLQTNDAI